MKLVDLFPEAGLVLVGSEYKKAGQGMRIPNMCFRENSDTAQEDIKTFLSPGKTVLLKGSRGMKLEKLWPDESN